MTKLQKQMLALINTDGGSHCASDWAYEATPSPFTNAKYMARIDAVIDLAKLGDIINHDTITYHAKTATCWKCDY